MAVLTRRSWQEMRTEVEAVLGGEIYTNLRSRIQYWMWDAYNHICMSFHHYELEKEIIESCSQGDSEIGLPADCYAVYGVTEVDSGGKTVSILANKNEMVRMGLWIPTEGQPDKYARAGAGGTRLQLNRPCDQSRRYRIDYLKIPTAPDYSSTSFFPETAELWDAAIMDMTLARLGARTLSDSIFVPHKELLGDFLGMQIQPALNDEPPVGLPNRPKIDSARGGNQG